MKRPVRIPPKGRSKVIQMYIGGVPFLRWGYDYHKDVIEDTLKERQIPFEQITLERCEIEIKGPAKDDGDCGHYILVGAGTCFRENDTLTFSGSSRHYKIGIDAEHLIQCAPTFEKAGFKYKVMSSTLI